MKARTLVARDADLAAALGVIGVPGDADFGVDFGVDFGDDEWGVDAPADLAKSVAAPHAGAATSRFAHTAAMAQMANQQHPASPFHPANRQATMTMWNKAHAGASKTAQREALLEPNKGSSTKVERYTFSLGVTTLVLGTATAITLSNQPSVNFRPERFTCNVDKPGFVDLTTIQVANVNAIVGGTEDAWTFNPNSVGISLSLPTLSPSNKATVTGTSTTFVPPGYNLGASYGFKPSFTGWATIVA